MVAALVSPMVVDCPASGRSCQLSLDHLGWTSDQRYFGALWEAARVSIRDFHQLPSWNPYHCGGIVLYQDPQAPFPGPLFLLTFFWLPTAVAIKLWIVAHLLVGAFGARALVADSGGNAAEQVLGATLMGACGFFAEHIGGGHLSFTPFLFLPFILWALRRALRDLRYAVLVAALFALAAIEGGTYAVPLMAVAVAVECLARLGDRSDRRALVRIVPLALGLAALLSAVRLLPVWMYLREHPRVVPLDDAVTLSEIFRFWTTRAHTRGVVAHKYVWPEYDDYVGFAPVVVMLLGALVALCARGSDGRRRRIDLALCAALVWCALGNIKGPSLWRWLHQLPIYRSLRVPSRFLGPAMVGFGLLAAGAWSWQRRALSRYSRRFEVALLCAEIVFVVVVAADVTLTNRRVIQQGLDPVLPSRAARAAFFQNTAADYGAFPEFPVAGFGTRACYVPLEWKPAAGIVDGRVAQARVEPRSAGTVTETGWSPNRVDLDVRLTAPATLVVNQNYEAGWRAAIDGGGPAEAITVGAFVSAQHRFWDVRATPRLPAAGALGLLAVRLPPGSHHLALSHHPAGLGSGALLSLLGVSICLAILKKGKGHGTISSRQNLII